MPAFADPIAYVRARAADADGAVEAAAAGYAAALAGAPDDEVIAIRAYREGLAAGDYALVRRAAAVLAKSKVAPPDASLFAFADAVRANDLDAADAAAAGLAEGPLDFTAPVLRAWIAHARGQDPQPLLDAVGGSSLTRRYAGEHRILLMIAAGRIDEAVTGLRALMGGEQDGVDLRVDAAQLFAARGQKRLALSLLQGDEPAFAALRKRLGNGTRPSPAFGTARLFTRLARDIGADEPARPLAILLTRAALLADPGDDRARLLLAEALSEDGAHARALATLLGVARTSPFRHQADTKLIGALDRAGRGDEALAFARTLANGADATAADAQEYGDLLAERGRHAEAADAYRTAIQRAGEQAGWVLHLQAGGALEKAGRWSEALPALRRAVELGPDQPVALNYLGYSQVERGENIAGAQALLERASKLEPDNPAITDSLGWAYFQGGDARKALPLLERAAQAEPGDTTINEHLGDAYWHLGRRFEARYAWKAAALYAEGDDATRIAAKLDSGPARNAAN